MRNSCLQIFQRNVIEQLFLFCFCAEEGSSSLGCESVFHECDHLIESP